MLDSVTKNRINTARDILVGKVPDPKSQVEQITIALIYKFMDDMDVEAEELGGKRTFFSGDYAKYSWRKIFDPRQSGHELLNLYSEAITKMDTNPGVPKLFRDIFKNAYLPYRDPETLKSFLKIINEFEYTHSEKLGDAFEFLLSILGSQGDAGQFRTPRHIIDFMVAIIDPKKNEVILDPACGTAGFLISSYKHIIKQNSANYVPDEAPKVIGEGTQSVNEVILSTNGYAGDKLTADERRILADNMHGYDISPDMVRLSLVNMYLHGVKEPQIFEYDSLTSEDHWNEYSDVILANPPFMSPKGGIRPHKRFSVQSNRSEVLFVDYIAEHLTQDGRAAVIVPEGIIFQSGNAYKQLRKMLVDKYLVGVISLPAGVFNPYSGVKTSILWLDKSLAKKTDKILFVKIDNDGFDLGAQRRAIKGNDLPDALQKISYYKGYILFGNMADFELGQNNSLVKRNEISINGDYNLSAERYTVKEKNNSNYSLVKLASLHHFVRGVTYTKTDEVDNNGTAILRANNINLTSGNLDLTDIRYIKKEVKVKEEQRLIKDDILICTASGSIDHIGKVAYSENDTMYYFGGFMGVIRSDSSKILPRFLFINLKSKEFRDYIQGATVGANIRNLKSSIIDSFEIPLPPLPVQEEIVSEIQSYQKIIDGARQVVENYKPRIDIDQEWEMVKLGNVLNFVSSGSTPKGGKEIYTNTGVLFIRSQNILNGFYDFTDCVYIPQDVHNAMNRSKVELGDVFLNITGASIGRSAVMDMKIEANVNQHVALLRCTHRLKPEFLSLFLNSENGQQQIFSMQAGASREALNYSQIKQIKVSLPAIDIQQQIVSEIVQEQTSINGNKQLIIIFEKKIKDRIAKVWGGPSVKNLPGGQI
jgi:type I restriction enzyme M protein